MTVLEIITGISKTIDDLLDFVVNNNYLSEDFKDFLTKNNIVIERQSELNDVLISYILDERTKDNTLVLDYFIQNNPSYQNLNIINSLKNNFLSVFRVKKILKNAYECESLTNERDFTLIPLVKMTNLRGIGLFDYIKARIIEINNNFYLLEIYDVIGQYRELDAIRENIKYIIKKPECVLYLNNENKEKIEHLIKSFNESFLECFKTDEIVTVNTFADKLLKEFNNYHLSQSHISDFNSLIKEPDEYVWYDIEKTEDNFLENASMGFLNTEKVYDVGFYADKNAGLYIIPFLGTVNKILKDNSFKTVQNAKKCLMYFIQSDKVTPSLLIKKEKEFKTLLPLVNQLSNRKFNDIREIINFYKSDWLGTYKISPTIALYNSKYFEKLIDTDTQTDKKKEAGRNEPCPCGSGKKYKKCCGMI